ncbi:MAG: hypothetical protein CVV49_16505 [Spirochaetae bacterium HGW-Spirochaetae-5]|nr:MAG: hypothetical protein CVV49_16505 [Spirochaetae bacterium HGW-Spirochaetae-5]
MNFLKKIKISEIKNRVLTFYSDVKTIISDINIRIRTMITETREGVKNSVKERNRVIILSLSLLFILDYIMLSYHTGKNIFDIFPSIPVLEDKKTVNIYIPSEGCTEILSEKREIYSNLEDESLVKRLFELVADGSYYENTSENVPVSFLIKKIWLVNEESGDGKVCVIDLSPATLEKDMYVVKGSEQMFKDSLEKTLVENIPGIKKVILLEKGVPFRKLWEI